MRICLTAFLSIYLCTILFSSSGPPCSWHRTRSRVGDFLYEQKHLDICLISFVFPVYNLLSFLHFPFFSIPHLHSWPALHPPGWIFGHAYLGRLLLLPVWYSTLSSFYFLFLSWALLTGLSPTLWVPFAEGSHCVYFFESMDNHLSNSPSIMLSKFSWDVWSSAAFAHTASPPHVNEFCAKSMFLSPIC